MLYVLRSMVENGLHCNIVFEIFLEGKHGDGRNVAVKRFFDEKASAVCQNQLQILRTYVMHLSPNVPAVRGPGTRWGLRCLL